VVRTRSDGAIDSQPFVPLGPEHAVNLAIEQLTQRDESLTERAVTVGTWTRAIESESDCSVNDAERKPGNAADDDTEPDFTNDSKPDGAGAGTANTGDSFTVGASSGDAVAA
jgi:hypothetical protein